MISIMLARSIIPGAIGSTEVIYNSHIFNSSFHGIYEKLRSKSSRFVFSIYQKRKTRRLLSSRHEINLSPTYRSASFSAIEVCSLNTEQIDPLDFVDVKEIRHARYFRYSSVQSMNLGSISRKFLITNSSY